MSATGRGGEYSENGSYQTAIKDCRGLLRLLPFLSTPQVILEPGVGDGNWLTALAEQEVSTGVRHRVGAMDIDARAPGLMLARARGGFAMTGDFLTTTMAFRPTVVLGNPAFAIPQPPIVCPRCGGRKVLTGKDKIRKACTKCGSKKKKPTGYYQPPPIPVAEKHMRRALEIVAPGGHVAFLLRLPILETAERIPFWRDHGPRRGLRCVFSIARRLSFTGGSTDATAYGFFWWESGYTGPTELVTVDHLAGM